MAPRDWECGEELVSYYRYYWHDFSYHLHKLIQHKWCFWMSKVVSGPNACVPRSPRKLLRVRVSLRLRKGGGLVGNGSRGRVEEVQASSHLGKSALFAPAPAQTLVRGNSCLDCERRLVRNLWRKNQFFPKTQWREKKRNREMSWEARAKKMTMNVRWDDLDSDFDESDQDGMTVKRRRKMLLSPWVPWHGSL